MISNKNPVLINRSSTFVQQTHILDIFRYTTKTSKKKTATILTSSNKTMNADSKSCLSSLVIASANNVSVLELSKQHTVCLLFTKWLTNPYCQQAVLDMCNYLPIFLKNNIIPIVCYQESACAWFDKATAYEFHVADVLKIAQIPKSVHVALGIKTTSFASHLLSLFTMINFAKQNPSVLSFAFPSGCSNPLIQRTLVFVHNGNIQHCWKFANCERIEYEKYEKKIYFIFC